MTTIACDGKTMAGDTQEITGGDVRLSDDAVKVIALDDGSVLGASGEAHGLPAFAKWINEGEQDGLRPAGFDVTLLRLFPDGRVVDGRGKAPGWFPRKVPCAIGTGQEFALGAMAAGATASRAVAIAIRYDVFSGGDVTALTPRDLA